MPYCYIVECSDRTLYVGSTWNLDLRLHQHNHTDEGAAYTRCRRPVRLVWAGLFDSVAEAFAFEKGVQGWRRDKRWALVRGDFDALPGLSSRGWSALRERGSGGFETGAERLPQPPDPACDGGFETGLVALPNQHPDPADGGG